MAEKLNYEFKTGDRVSSSLGTGIIVASAAETESKSILVMHDEASDEFHGAHSEKYYKCPPGKENNHYFYNARQLTLIKEEPIKEESTNTPINLVGRYIKVLNTDCKDHYGIKNGDYLLFDIENSCGTYEHWGDPGVKHYHGINVHKDKHFELMPEGFNPFTESTETVITTFGLSLNQKLSAVDIREWCNVDKNKWHDGTWRKSMGTFVGDREIENFDIKDGIITFLVSNTEDVWLKAEGFKEFCEGRKVKKETPIPFTEFVKKLPVKEESPVKKEFALLSKKSKQRLMTSVSKTKSINIKIK